MMQLCDWQTNLPRQGKIGRASRQPAKGVWPSGAIAWLNFTRKIYMIEGRVYNNADLAISVNWAGRTIYMKHRDGIDIRGGKARLDLPPGTYDILQIDPQGGYWRNNISVPFDKYIEPRPGTSFVQLVIVFPAGTLTEEEKEALVMPININADWLENDPDSAAYIANKPDVVTKIELEGKVLEEVAQAVIQVGVAQVSFREGAEEIEYSTSAFPNTWFPFVSYDLLRGETGFIYAWNPGDTAVVNRSYAYDNKVWRAKTATQTNPVAGANWEFLYDGAATTHNHDDRYYLKALTYTKTEVDEKIQTDATNIAILQALIFG